MSTQHEPVAASPTRRPAHVAPLAALLLACGMIHPAAAAPSSGAPVETALSAAVSGDEDLRDFYRARGFRPLWVDDGALRPAAKRLLARLAGAADDGLSPDRYGAARIAAAAAAAEAGDAAALLQAETLLSAAYGRFLADLHRPSAAAAMNYVHDGLAPATRTPAEWLAAAGKAGSLDRHVDRSLRLNPLYEELRAGYAAYRARWANLPATRVPPGPMLRQGAGGPRVAALRERLGLPAGALFDAALADRLREFQAVHGLPVDGAAGPRTIAALNEGPGRYERLVRANLERARAIPADPGERFLVVDAAGATLRAYEDGQVRETMRVIIGKPDMQTPAMAGRISYAVLNPYWNLPPDLAQVRAQRVLEEGTGILAQERLEALSGWEEDARVLSPAEVDWAAVASGKQMLRMRQTPGPHNMMGKVKFMLPNRLGIYLHDTPQKSLFGADDRRFSSGCVRLADAPRLARFLFEGRAPDPAKAGKEERVDLPGKGVPVYITYLTVQPRGDGQLAFRSDPYKRDGALLAALGSAGGGQAGQGLR